jgi:phosphoribosylformylglycinamidine synthase subunit PurS
VDGVERRYAVDVMPKPGILDPQGRAVEGTLRNLAVEGVRDVRVGRRIELTVVASTPGEGEATVQRLARELFANPLIERWDVQELEGGFEG